MMYDLFISYYRNHGMTPLEYYNRSEGEKLLMILFLNHYIEQREKEG